MIAIGRDPNLFSDPDSFLPERWLVDPTKPTLRPEEFSYPVFWGGPRLCLGKDMARLEALNIAHVLLKSYRFEVLPHSERMVNGPVQFYEDGLPVVVHARD
jgi:cytochrome P450